MARRGCLLILAALALAPAAAAATRLTIEKHPGGAEGPTLRYTLRCGPPRGTLPRAARACAELAAHGDLLLAPAKACPYLLTRTTPYTLVRGMLGGRAVDRRANPLCGADIWRLLPTLVH
jgi:hypothetical protein